MNLGSVQKILVVEFDIFRIELVLDGVMQRVRWLGINLLITHLAVLRSLSYNTLKRLTDKEKEIKTLAGVSGFVRAFCKVFLEAIERLILELVSVQHYAQPKSVSILELELEPERLDHAVLEREDGRVARIYNHPVMHFNHPVMGMAVPTSELIGRKIPRKLLRGA